MELTKRHRSVLKNKWGEFNPNRYTIHGDVAHIELTDREDKTVAIAKVSLCDLNRVISAGRWHCSFRKTVRYASRAYRVDGKVRIDRMHQFILDYPECEVIDHINGDSLDNRRENLRATTHSVNQRNRRSFRVSTTGVPNVRRESKNRWRVRFNTDGRLAVDRNFDSFEAAVKFAEEVRHVYSTRI